jgi:hypothetical protein
LLRISSTLWPSISKWRKQLNPRLKFTFMCAGENKHVIGYFPCELATDQWSRQLLHANRETCFKMANFFIRCRYIIVTSLPA